ncbi:L-seryl-tRNA(Sec) selenium transferase [uncultured Ellagibacter sp.]|uniref:L-seryl-tRNA(Sec) selenium transferase n=1 Tax=uncultured Ellagibacter sp. TaxID=2137580 RepID=UPI00262538F5|nr:L-seryl-tRNA(Sec) selenium transferase [uncultured Ellagibacter sp.]
MTSQPSHDKLRSLPQVEEVLRDASLEALSESVPRDLVCDAVRASIDEARQAILAGSDADTSIPSIVQATRMRLLALNRPSLRHVVNASGVIIHTNLGRSVLAPAAVRAVNEVASGYSTLEYDTDAMARGSRHAHCEQLICTLTGAEAAIAVNNNAAAVMMVLSEFAAGHEAVVSRGELVEIGGSFRIPDIMAQSHATMVEVGATNKTHLSDYTRAVTPGTAMVLKVHPSNYRLIGFTESVAISDLRALADDENAAREQADGTNVGKLLVYEDQGSGAFMRLTCFGDYAEPTVAESLHAGADLVSFSGDKLLGGPQAGIIVGAKPLIDRLKKNPLARALRLDKMTLAALEATLRLYLNPENARREVPTLRMLTETADEVFIRAKKLAGVLKKALPSGACEISLVEEISRAGGGALPMCDIPTYCVQVQFTRGDALSCDRHLVSERLVPVVGRLKKEMLLFDARTILDDAEMKEIARACAEYFEGI